MSSRLSVVAATSDYEHWLRGGIALREHDLVRKHALMRQSPTRFLRGTYYLWLERFVHELGELLQQPRVLAAGDVHIENFGTWLTRAGEQVWGINDFDEVDFLPFTLDLVRAAASLRVALDRMHRKDDVIVGLIEALLEGWRHGVDGAISPIVLNSAASRVEELLPVRDATEFWHDLRRLETAEKVPAAAQALLSLAAASPRDGLSWHIRVAGVGSLGHRRFVAFFLGATKGAREMKELGSPTVSWPPAAGVGARGTDEAWHGLMREDRRAPEGHVRFEAWQSRRLAPENVRIDVEQLTANRKAREFAGSAGQAVAAVHVADLPLARAALVAESGLDPHWLRDASHAMAKQVIEDYRSWCQA